MLSRPILAALGAAMLFGVSTPVAKHLVGQVDPWLLAGLLYVGSGVGLALFAVLARGRRAQEAAITRAQAPWLAGAIFAGGVVAPVLLVQGLTVVSGIAASLLLNLEVVATALIAWLIVREHTNRRLILGLIAIVAGGAVLSLAGGEASRMGAWWGPLAIVGACVCWGIDNACTRPASAADPVLVAMWKGLIAGSVNTLIALLSGAHLPAIGPLVLTLAVGFFGYGISLVLFVIALRHLGTGRTGAYFATAPFIGALTALALGDSLTWPLVAAGVLMGAGLWLHVTEVHAHLHRHEELDHDHAHEHDAHHQHVHHPGDPPGPVHRHPHHHAPLTHNHPHVPDLHHRHSH